MTTSPLCTVRRLRHSGATDAEFLDAVLASLREPSEAQTGAMLESTGLRQPDAFRACCVGAYTAGIEALRSELGGAS